MIWMKKQQQFLRCGRLFNPMGKKGLISMCIVLILLYLYNQLMNIFIFNSRQRSPSSIGIFLVANDEVAGRYDPFIDSLSCYAHWHTYRFILMNPKHYPQCTNMSENSFFQKHCLVSAYLLENVHLQWLLVLDIDILVVNLSKKIESYLPDAADSDSSIHMIFYERFNGEIASENYLIHNHPWSHQFLSHWMEYEQPTKHFKFHNHDNGPLHVHLLGDMVGDVSQSTYDHCFRIYEKATNAASYHTFVGCCKCALDGRWEFEHLRILRRGHSFVRDNLGHDMKKRIWSPTDFLIHGHEQNIGTYYSKAIDTYECVNSEWYLPIREDVIMTNFTEVKETIKKFDHAAAKAYPQSVGLPDISDCWPNCVNNEARRQAFIEKVCHEDASWRSH